MIDHMGFFIISLLISVVYVIIIVIPQISCQTPTCGNNTFFIHYPFHLLEENQNPADRHFKTEFILKCNNNGSVVISLPFSGDFYVRNIDYFEQKIHLYDPGNCLPGRLMHNFSLPASSSFWLVSYKSYTFFRCPTGNLTSLLNDDLTTVIGCLSNSTSSVLATSLVSRSVQKGCKTIASNLEIPDFDYEYKGSKGDLVLAWYDPSCGEDCKERVLNEVKFQGAFVISEEEGLNYKPHSKPVIKIIIVCLITISTAILGALFCIGCCLRLIGKVLHIDEERTSPILALHPSRTRRHTLPPNERAQTSGSNIPTDPRTHNDEFQFTLYQNERAQTSGLNIATGPQAHNDELQFASSTEEMIIGGAEWISGPNSDSCPICLGEYQASDKLRRVCKCDHCFHAHCLEMWFKRKSTCPVCRISVK